MKDIGLYEVPLSISLLGFGMGTMLANFHMCGIMLVLGAVFTSPVRTKCGMFVMYCMQCCMSLSAVL